MERRDEYSLATVQLDGKLLAFVAKNPQSSGIAGRFITITTPGWPEYDGGVLVYSGDDEGEAMRALREWEMAKFP